MHKLNRSEVIAMRDTLSEAAITNPDIEKVMIKVIAFLNDCLIYNVGQIDIVNDYHIQKPERQRKLTPFEKTRAQVYATGNRHQIENFNAVHGR